MTGYWYSELENKFPDIQCDVFVCMPNHVHFIAVNVGADLRVRPDSGTCPDSMPRQTMGEHLGSPLHRVVQWFKTMSTNEYICGVKQDGWQPFSKKLWQRNYWEHIVRNETELNRIREYIQNNPAQWDLDRLNPINVGADLRVRPGSGDRPDSGDQGSTGQTHRSAPTKIREPSAIYRQSAGPVHPNDDGWMI